MTICTTKHRKEKSGTLCCQSWVTSWSWFGPEGILWKKQAPGIFSCCPDSQAWQLMKYMKGFHNPNQPWKTILEIRHCSHFQVAVLCHLCFFVFFLGHCVLLSIINSKVSVSMKETPTLNQWCNTIAGSLYIVPFTTVFMVSLSWTQNPSIHPDGKPSKLSWSISRIGNCGHTCVGVILQNAYNTAINWNRAKVEKQSRLFSKGKDHCRFQCWDHVCPKQNKLFFPEQNHTVWIAKFSFLGWNWAASA